MPTKAKFYVYGVMAAGAAAITESAWHVFRQLPDPAVWTAALRRGAGTDCRCRVGLGAVGAEHQEASDADADRLQHGQHRAQPGCIRAGLPGLDPTSDSVPSGAAGPQRGRVLRSE